MTNKNISFYKETDLCHLFFFFFALPLLFSSKAVLSFVLDWLCTPKVTEIERRLVV